MNEPADESWEEAAQTYATLLGQEECMRVNAAIGPQAAHFS